MPVCEDELINGRNNLKAVLELLPKLTKLPESASTAEINEIVKGVSCKDLICHSEHLEHELRCPIAKRYGMDYKEWPVVIDRACTIICVQF